MRVVLDTNILVRANPKVLPSGLARKLLLTIVSEPHVLILSSAILIEVKHVPAYPRVQTRWPLTEDAIDQYLSFIEAASFSVELPAVLPAVVSDPDDDPILQTAIAGKADILCTRDAAFRHELVEQACAAHGIRIQDDVTLLRELWRSTK